MVAGEPPPALQDPISVVDMMEVQGALPQMMCYQICMQGLDASGQLDAMLRETLRPCCGEAGPTENGPSASHAPAWDERLKRLQSANAALTARTTAADISEGNAAARGEPRADGLY